ncbi:MAG: hypothetical protein FJW86_06775 [Actinobacteria bacterium]|nr:hypothetical protein [Actinomycetota bacterium]
MRKLAILAATAVGSAGLLAAAAPAGAATPRVGNDDFCEASVDFQDSFGVYTGEFDPDSIEALADSLRKASRFAPKKVKKAMRRVAKLYERVADDEEYFLELLDVTDLARSDLRFVRDSVTYSTYYLETCSVTVTPAPQP